MRVVDFPDSVGARAGRMVRAGDRAGAVALLRKELGPLSYLPDLLEVMRDVYGTLARAGREDAREVLDVLEEAFPPS